MTPDELRAARTALGHMWGLERPLRMSELGRALRLSGRDPGASIWNWERGRSPIKGQVAVAIEAMLAGYRPSFRVVTATGCFRVSINEINKNSR